MSAPIERGRAANALAILTAQERDLLAANGVWCLVCGADDQAGILACLETMDACINLHGFPGIPCTLEARRVPGADATGAA
jgi:hypothetical protein